MKQSEIVTGERYLFKTTIDQSKNDMIGKTFCVIKSISGKSNKKAYFKNKRGKKPNRYLLDNGRYAKACELSNPNTEMK